MWEAQWTKTCHSRGQTKLPDKSPLSIQRALISRAREGKYPGAYYGNKHYPMGWVRRAVVSGTLLYFFSWLVFAMSISLQGIQPLRYPILNFSERKVLGGRIYFSQKSLNYVFFLLKWVYCRKINFLLIYYFKLLQFDLELHCCGSTGVMA